MKALKMHFEDGTVHVNAFETQTWNDPSNNNFKPFDIFYGSGLLHIIFWVQIYQNINFLKFWPLGLLPILNNKYTIIK